MTKGGKEALRGRRGTDHGDGTEGIDIVFESRLSHNYSARDVIEHAERVELGR